MNAIRLTFVLGTIAVMLTGITIAGEEGLEQFPCKDFAVGTAIQKVAFSPDGETIAVGDPNGFLSIWDARTGKLTKKWRAQNSPVWEVVYSRDGKLLATAGKVDSDTLTLDSEIKVWETQTYAQKERLNSYGYVYGIDFSPDGVLLAASLVTNFGIPRDGNLTIWQLEGGKVVRSHIPDLPKYEQWVTSLNFSPDGKTLAFSAGKTYLLSVLDGKVTLVGDGAGSRYVRFLDGGTTLLTVSKDISFWKSNDNDLLIRLNGTRTGGLVSISPDESFLALIDSTGFARDEYDNQDDKLVLIDLRTKQRSERPFRLGPVRLNWCELNGSQLAVGSWRSADGQAIGQPAIIDITRWQASYSSQPK